MSDAFENMRVHMLGLADALADDEFNGTTHEVLDEIERHNCKGGDYRCRCLTCKAPFTAVQPASVLVVMILKLSGTRFATAVCRQCMEAGGLRERVQERLVAMIDEGGEWQSRVIEDAA